jgi:thioredoxin 1
MSSFRFVAAILVAAALIGCGGSTPSAAVKTDTTSAANCANCTGSDSAGAICETPLDTTAAAGTAVVPEAPEPPLANKAEPKPTATAPEPEKVADKPSALPKMWDFGSEKCIPCKTMLEILTPMMTDYKSKVDIRIIDVYQEAELTKQFRIVTIPTQVFLDAEGKELLRHIGVYPRDSIEACFQKFGFPVVTGAVSPSQPPAFGST